MTRYLLADVVELRLTRVENGRWSFYRCTNVMRDGARTVGNDVNTVEQAEQRRIDFYPNARVIVEEPA